MIIAAHLCEGDAARRETWLYLVALPLGYGHLLGGLIFARRRLREMLRSTSSGASLALVGSMILTLLALYTSSLADAALGPFVVLALLFVSAWHVVENDIELGHAYTRGLALGGMRRSRAEWLVMAMVIAVVFGAALATPSGAELCRFYDVDPPLPPWLTLADLATLVLLYHAVSWVLFFVERARRAPAPRARAIRRQLFWVHAAPLALNAVTYIWVEPVFRYLVMPTLYLFWSALHAFQTAVVRSARARSGAVPHALGSP
jgi:hypothetical protein